MTTAAIKDDSNRMLRIESFPIELSIAPSSERNDPNSSDFNSNFLSRRNLSDEDESNVIHFVKKPTSLDETEAKNLNSETPARFSKSSNSINENLAIATSYRFWNPLRLFIDSPASMEDVESRIFNCVKSRVERYYVNIRNNDLKIWTMSVNRESNEIPIVLVHGFCGAIALWVPNIDELSESRPFHAFDLLGFGRSSRPLFSNDPIVAEAQFVESIEDWRKEMNLEEFILLGHSFGGFLATAYSIKYPNRVRGLILADPWGFPERPNNMADTPLPLWVRAISKVIQYVSPLAVVRFTGQMGVNLFKKLRPDFRYKYSSLLDEPDLIYTYIYYANCLPPSGEYGFKAIAEFLGWAKNPMIKRIQDVNDNIPVWFIYGGRSWINHTPGFTSVNLRQNAISTNVKLITGAGHHVYADKAKEFNDYVKYIYKQIDDFAKNSTSENSEGFLNESSNQPTAQSSSVSSTTSSE